MCELVDARIVAEHFGVTVATVHAWRRKGLIPAIRPSKGAIRFRLREVEEAVAVTARVNTTHCSELDGND